MMDSTDNRALPQGDRATTPDGAEPVVSGKAGIPSALTASAFIFAIADIFQAKHYGPLSRDIAIREAVGALEAVETPQHPFGHPDLDWTVVGAQEVAAEAMQHWEPKP